MTKQLTPETDYGQFRCGEKNRNAKLNEWKVICIRFFLGIGSTQKAIAEVMEVSQATIGKINTKRTWRWL